MKPIATFAVAAGLLYLGYPGDQAVYVTDIHKFLQVMGLGFLMLGVLAY